VNEDALERVTEHFEDAVAKGAKVITGGKAHGLYFNPTVLTDVRPEMRVYSEESFGPIVAIVPVDGVDEAIRVANDTEYGLSAAVFSSDVDAALAVASQLQTGMCHINDATVNDEPPMPFGGVKDSGWGRFGGKAALEEFTELRWITIQDSPRDYPI
jgi:vanillin dehydrogenase